MPIISQAMHCSLAPPPKKKMGKFLVQCDMQSTRKSSIKELILSDLKTVGKLLSKSALTMHPFISNFGIIYSFLIPNRRAYFKY